MSTSRSISRHGLGQWRVRLNAMAAVAVVLICGVAPAAAQVSPQDNVSEARRLYDLALYEDALKAATMAVQQLVAIVPMTPETRTQLAAAYELSARARFSLNETASVKNDLQSLLRFNPEYSLPLEVSPKLKQLFDSVRQETVGAITLSVTPDDADVQIDNLPLGGRSGTMPLAIGPHTITASRPSFKTESPTVTVTPGATQPVTITLERLFATLSIYTAPDGVEVIVDGVSQGRTPSGEPTPKTAEVSAALGVPQAVISAPILVTNLTPGDHTLEYRKPCYVSPPREAVSITKLTDLRTQKKLNPATTTLKIDADVPGAAVFLGDIQKGQVPATIPDVCEGDYVMEVRSPQGRYVDKLKVRAGEPQQIQAKVRPAFAILSSSGAPEGVRGSEDLRVSVQDALKTTTTVALFAPEKGKAEQLLGDMKPPLSPKWLAFNRQKEEIGDKATPGERLILSEELSSRVDGGAQGVAAVTVEPGEDLSRPTLLLSLLASGSSVPDVVPVRLSDPMSVRDAISVLNFSMTLYYPWAGLLVVDVLNEPGPIVAAVDAGQPAATAGLSPGDRILTAGGQPMSNAAAFLAAMEAAMATGMIAIEYNDRANAKKAVELKITAAPRAVSRSNRSVLFNNLLVDLRYRLWRATGTRDESVLRLNIGIALMALGNYQAARQELEGLRFDPGTGVAAGTVQYLLGECYQALSMFAEAEKAWTAAATSDAWLTEDGPPVKPLAEAALAASRRRVP